MNAVYLLCYEEEIVYIGKSINVKSRIQGHKTTDKIFDSVVIMSIPNEVDMHILEVVLINKFKPIYNIDSKAEDAMSISIKLQTTTIQGIKEYVLTGKGLTEEDVVSDSSVVAGINSTLLDMVQDIDQSSILTRSGFSYSVLQKTSLAVRLAGSRNVSGVYAMKKYGVKPASYNILNRYYDPTKESHIKFITDVIQGESKIKSIPSAANILKDLK